MKNNKMMEKMENGEKVIGMLCHVTIGLRYQSCECAPSWVSNYEGCVTGVTSLHSRSVQGRDSNKELSSIRVKSTSKGYERSIVDWTV